MQAILEIKGVRAIQTLWQMLVFTGVLYIGLYNATEEG